jgi:S-adenosylmethionine:tRNA ribosyltransferase-isomerase
MPDASDPLQAARLEAARRVSAAAIPDAGPALSPSSLLRTEHAGQEPVDTQTEARSTGGRPGEHVERESSARSPGALAPEDFDFPLPPELIAQAPCPVRSASRMLVVGPWTPSRIGGASGQAPPPRSQTGPRPSDAASSATHAVGGSTQGLAPSGEPLALRIARELPSLLPPDALVVLNDSRVVAARVYPTRADGRRFEVLFSEPRPSVIGDVVTAWVRGARRLAEGDVLRVEALQLRYLGPDPLDERGRRFVIEAGDFLATLRAFGEVPLPPYVSRPTGPTPEDRERYQTVYARHEGSVAAPTAGLHLDASVLSRLDTVALTLHVGPGTFLPMEVSSVEAHRVPAERVSLGEAEAGRIRAAQAEGRPIVAIGTTTTRALEGIAARSGEIRAYEGAIDLVITPGFPFRVVDLLFTNFHLPRSSLLMLVCAFGGRERVLAAYAEAVHRRLRFYSYGDCMLLARDGAAR